MTIYLCATEEAMAVCLAQHLTSLPLGILTIGNPSVPLMNEQAALPATLLEWTEGADLASLHECEPLAILADERLEIDEDLQQSIRQTLRLLADAGHVLVFAPPAIEFAGIQPAVHPTGMPLTGEDSPLVPAIILAHVENDIHVADALQRIGAYGRLLALDGPVYVEYTPIVRLLTVHGAGSALVLTPDLSNTGSPVAAKAFILTNGMTQKW